MIIDTNNDNLISDKEIENAQKISELEQKIAKSETQKKMAWVALFAMILLTCLLYTPFIPIERVNSISELIGMFFIAQASIVGAYMGISAWMSKK